MIGFLALSLAFLATLTGYSIYIAWPTSKYLYANARVSARSSELLDTATIERLASARNFQEFLASLKDTPYMDGVNCKNCEEFHRYLEMKYLGELEDIKKDCPKEFQKIVDAYMMRYEARIIKLFIKQKLRNVEIPEYLVFPVGELSKAILDEMKAAETVNDLAVVMQKTKFADLFATDFWSGKTWEDISLRIDRYVESRFISEVKRAKIPNKKDILEIWNDWLISRGILMLMKAKIRGVSQEDQVKLIKDLGLPELKPLAEANLEEIEKVNFPMDSLIRENLDLVKSGDIGELEKRLNRTLIEKARSLALRQPTGVYPIFLYFLEKRNEKKALQIVSKGVSAGLSKEEIEEMLI